MTTCLLPCILPGIFNLGTGEMIVILVVILLLFGAKRIPELARSIGKGINSFKSGLNETVDEIEKGKDVDADKTSSK